MSADMKISKIAETVSRKPPPLARRSSPRIKVRIKPKNFGASRMAIVIPNSISARSASNRGQDGNSENSRVKYSGRT